jgi:carboxypeptidase C (cathepsin A)
MNNRLSRTKPHAATAICVLMLAGLTASPVPAQPAGEAGTNTPPARRFEASGEAQIGGERVRYRTLVEESFVTNAEGQRTASLVSTSYIRENVTREAVRPVVFVFNGGPGSAGLWLQMGLMGPRRVDFEDDVNPPTVPPFRLADNAESPLDVTDIVIFDPPGTGFSRVLPAGKIEEFYGVQQDAQLTVNFVRDWVQRHGRFNSPRFLVGESYGTIRAAIAAKLMAGGPFGTGSMDAITLNGVILLGQAMGGDAGEASFANSLPSLAATAWYHGKVDQATRSLEEHVADAQSFASGEYLVALYAGSRLAADARQRIAERIAGLIGLPASLVLENDLRVSSDTFSTALLADRGQQVGKYDSRFVLPLAASGNDPVADDPAMGQYVPGFVAALNMHLRDEVGARLEEPYLPIEFRKVNSRWDYGSGPGVPTRGEYAKDLAVAMRRNPSLRLFVGTGYYDLVTTVGAAEYTVAHADFPAERVTLRNYASGHMPYLGTENRRQLADDLRNFINGASRP